MPPAHDDTPCSHPDVSAAMLALVTDALAWPLLVLRPDATLLHANAAAHQLLRFGEPLVLTAGHRVRPSDSAHRAAFSAALDAAARGLQPPSLLHWLPARGLGCKVARHTVAATLTTLAAQPGAAAPVLLALSVGAHRSADTRAFAALYRLTEAEGRVLQRLALGENSKTAAAALGVAPATVRSQTVSLRRKTGHANVGALMRALADVPPLAFLPESPSRPGDRQPQGN